MKNETANFRVEFWLSFKKVNNKRKVVIINPIFNSRHTIFVAADLSCNYKDRRCDHRDSVAYNDLSNCSVKKFINKVKMRNDSRLLLEALLLK